VSRPDTIQNYRTCDDTTANHGKHTRNFIDTEDCRKDNPKLTPCDNLILTHPAFI
jgi:hypothetical protein